MFKRIKNYVQNKGLCFSMQSRSKKVTVSVCSDLDAARIETPYSDELVSGMDAIIPAISRAYIAAQDAKDETVMEELHGVRHTIAKAYA
jgi:hypothetical protein